jgi:hypothetical protein
MWNTTPTTLPFGNTELEGAMSQINTPPTDSDTEMVASAVPFDVEALTTDSLKKLQSSDERRLLDVVDKLRRTGLNGTIELPQLVVCGDQSSGKSSVLEAVSAPQKVRGSVTDNVDYRLPKFHSRAKQVYVHVSRPRLYYDDNPPALLLSRSAQANHAQRRSRRSCRGSPRRLPTSASFQKSSRMPQQRWDLARLESLLPSLEMFSALRSAVPTGLSCKHI